MNDFPCLLVRGICGYAGSHKNKVWQPYAKEVLSLIPTEVRATEAAGGLSNYHIPFSLKGVPVGKFANRPQDTEALRGTLIPKKQDKRRRILVVQGFGGAGKTQLAAGFSRRHQHSFSSVLWLDGSSESSLKRSITAFASRIPAGQVEDSSRMYASGQGGDADAVVKEVLRWLSIPDNSDWLVVVDNVDRDYRGCEEDTEAYDLEEPWEVKKVDQERARAIFKTWYGKEVVAGTARWPPLALTQAAAYMSETSMSFGT
ncbi:uncharacterized protein BDR25DRAFT_352584 [Lindgomyces ingoldianus]|uniref:Uncharacterized protein n=1 Tax=Lindgomyces ingoldianus TaxID=673940 RepID=A0ACB6R2V6_9PLEO|nr:uncharacterized protein BDR25DRAFT_352584 [Lindgomyces ingoldianus]KAF2473125.1 hypothetical protein BDR25DRAFT_352584 [Lindgomyces ingoldianus]